MNIVLDVLRYLSEHNITLVKAAEATGVAQQNIKKSIGNNPKTSTLLALAKGLGVDPREFFYDLDKEKIEETPTSFAMDAEQNGGEPMAENIADTTIKLPTEQQPMQTTAFCPHCGAKVRVGVVLLPE